MGERRTEGRGTEGSWWVGWMGKVRKVGGGWESCRRKGWVGGVQDGGDEEVYEAGGVGEVQKGVGG